MGLVRWRFCCLLPCGVPDRDPKIRRRRGFFFGDWRTDGCGAHSGFYWRLWCCPDLPQRLSPVGNGIIAYWRNPYSKTVRRLSVPNCLECKTQIGNITANYIRAADEEPN